MGNVKVKGNDLGIELPLQCAEQDHWINEVKDLRDEGIDFYVDLERPKKITSVSQKLNFSKKEGEFTGDCQMTIKCRERGLEVAMRS